MDQPNLAVKMEKNPTENDVSFRIYNYKQGICKNISSQHISLYFLKFKQILQTDKNIILLDSIQNWKREIYEDPIGLAYFREALKQLPELVASSQSFGKLRPSILYGYSVDEVFELLNAVTQTPPIFSLSELCGVPFGVLFIDITNTESGKKLFSLPQFNNHLKIIFDDYGSLLKCQKSLKYFN